MSETTELTLDGDDINYLERIARSVAPRATDHLLEELTAIGMLAAVEAAPRWDPDRAPRRIFLGNRAAGAMRDHLRSLDPLSRGRRALSRHLDDVEPELRHQLGRPPSDPELAERLGVAARRIRQARHDADNVPARSGRTFDPACSSDIEATAIRAVMAPHVHQGVSDALGTLSPMKRAVIEGWLAERSQTAMARELGVTPSRVNQIIKEAFAQLRPHLEHLT